MVLHKLGDKIYSGLVATMKSMTFHLEEIARSVETTEGDSFLIKLNRKWNDHSKALLLIGDILMYMDRICVPRTKKAPVYELGMNLWTETVIYSNQIRARLSNTLSELICRERVGEDVNRKLIKNITKMIMDLGPSVYEQVFETSFLQVSSEFYRAESQKIIERCNCGDYLKNVERLINEETDRVNLYLDPRTKSKITYVVKKEMIKNQLLRLIQMENSGLVNMLCGDKYEDLGIMYNLFRCDIDGLSKTCEVMTSHIRESGKQLVSDPEKLKDPVQFVQRLLHEKNKYDKIISLAFNNDKMFQNAVNSSFEFFINLNPRCPEYISLFIDNKLRKVLLRKSLF